MTEWIEQYWGIREATQWKIVYSAAAILSMYLLRFITFRIVHRRSKDPKDRYYWTRAVKITFGVVLLLFIVGIWSTEFRSLATFLGLLTAALTIALKDLVVNMAGWVFIIARRPFALGDRIQIGDYSGDVIDIRVFQFTINEIGNWVEADQSTGRIIHIPNGKVFTESQANFTQGFSHIWNEIGVLITFESNWEKAKEILEEVVNEHAASLSKAAEQKLVEASRKFMILYSKLTPIVYTTVKDSGVLLTMRYLITPRRRRGSEQAIWEDVLRSFARHEDIELAYPTQRIYYQPGEKEGTQSGKPEV